MLQQVGCLFQHVWCNKSVPTEVNGSAGLERTSMGDSAAQSISFKPNPQHRDRVRRSVTSAAGCAPEHPRPAEPKLFPIVQRQKSRRRRSVNSTRYCHQPSRKGTVALLPLHVCRWQWNIRIGSVAAAAVYFSISRLLLHVGCG